MNEKLNGTTILITGAAKRVEKLRSGMCSNDWRTLCPGADPFPYIISKAGLAAIIKSLAVTLAPKIIFVDGRSHLV